MGSINEKYSLTTEYHLDILQQVLRSSQAKESLVQSYTKSFNGFAARLTEEESQNLKSTKGVVSVFPSKTFKLQTTRSWDFMGLSDLLAPKNTSIETNLIIGMIDSGVWPESLSFNDERLDLPPKKWKGVCKGGKNFTCNNKVIGAWTPFDSARDDGGHGTHTASIAAGRIVDHASFYGFAEGTARGAVPYARIATYKVCDQDDSCSESNVLAAFDQAIADGVDFISVSLGGMAAEDMNSDSVAIGAFHAMQKGILTIQAAGNWGNDSDSVSSIAPWIFTVAASSLDRRFHDKAVLGNGKTLVGNSINSFTLKGDSFPLVFGPQASRSNCTEHEARICYDDCLEEKLVKGKIVVCDDIEVTEGFRAGALGVIGRNPISDVSLVTPIPAIMLNDHEFDDILLPYLNSTKSPKANILRSESFNDTFAPIVASFSSRGPNSIAFDILKPDITAPGVEILAAYPPISYVNTRKSNYTFLSGTSMSCPHVTSAAAYVKSIHPDWSPSAIKSALMTTAHPMSPSKNRDAEFAYGSGHLDPVKALNPGLVYETNEDDYLTFLCNLGYTNKKIIAISGNNTFSCPKKTNEIFPAYSPKDINYPTMASLVKANVSIHIKFSRTVTNVGVANSTYTAKVESTIDLRVKVIPNSLAFTLLNERKSFDVIVDGKELSPGSQVSASLIWSDGIHIVRSPIIIYNSRTFSA